MRRDTLIVLLVVLVLFGGLTAWVAAQGSASDPVRSDLARMSARLDSLESRLERTQGAVEGSVAGQGRLVSQLASLDGRMDDAGEGAAPSTRALNPPAVTAQPAASDASAVPETPDGTSPVDEFAALLALGVLEDGSEATPEQQARFWELARTTGALTDLMASLESRVSEDPADTDVRMDLADAYVAKLLTVPSGPERGVWGVKAEAQWQQVIDRDPEHWDAQFSQAENLSYYPAFLNRTDEALAGMERARTIQEELPSEPRHAKTYVLLSRLYVNKGQPDKARAALQQGLQRHPGNSTLQAALDALP